MDVDYYETLELTQGPRSSARTSQSSLEKPWFKTLFKSELEDSRRGATGAGDARGSEGADGAEDGNKETSRTRMNEDYYAILGLTGWATTDQIRKAYKNLALKYHPDKNPTEDTTELFKVIGNAYFTLMDVRTRESYDKKVKRRYKSGVSTGKVSKGHNSKQKHPRARTSQSNLKKPWFKTLVKSELEDSRRGATGAGDARGSEGADGAEDGDKETSRTRMNEDYYAILGLTGWATTDQIRKAYKKLALKYHPDKNPTEDTTELFKVIGNAYSTLMDVRARVSYDKKVKRRYKSGVSTGKVSKGHNWKQKHPRARTSQSSVTKPWFKSYFKSGDPGVVGSVKSPEVIDGAEGVVDTVGAEDVGVKESSRKKMNENYYEILEIAGSATTDQIRKAYKKLALKYHPDKNSAEDTTEQFKLMTNAYSTLINDRARQSYDKKLKRRFESGVSTGKVAIKGHNPKHKHLRAGSSGIFDPEPWVKSFLQSKGPGAVGNVEGLEGAKDAKLVEGLEVARGLEGGSKGFTFDWNTMNTKSPLNYNFAGSRVDQSFESNDKDQDQPVVLDVYVALEDIASGCTKHVHILEPIVQPDGKTVEKKWVLSFPVHPGCEAGKVIRFLRKDVPGENKPTVDIEFIIRDQPHQLFTRDGSNIRYTAKISYETASFGSKVIEVPTLTNGKSTFSFPPDFIVDENAVATLPGGGLPLPENPSVKGDLLVDFDIRSSTFYNEDLNEISVHMMVN